MTLYLFIIILAACGFCISFYIRYTKTKKQPLICPLRGNCHAVTGSSFSLFLGIPVELLGLLYYGILAVGYSTVIILPSTAERLAPLLLLLTTIGFLFSLYLTFIQVITIRKLCTWCLTSALITTICFSIGLVSDLSVATFYLQPLAPLISTISAVSLGIGIAGVAISLLLFFRFLRDFSISPAESQALRVLFELIWAALVILLISDATLFVANPVAQPPDSILLLKTTILSVLLATSLFLNFHIAPKLINVSYRTKNIQKTHQLHPLRRWAFSIGSLWVGSWLALLLCTLTPVQTENYWKVLALYAIMLLIFVFVSQAIERIYARKFSKSTELCT